MSMTNWQVTSNLIDGKKMYGVYRTIDSNKVDYSGNRETYGGYTDNRAVAASIAEELNLREGVGAQTNSRGFSWDAMIAERRAALTEAVAYAFERSLSQPGFTDINQEVVLYDDGQISHYERSYKERTEAELSGKGIMVCSFQPLGLGAGTPEHEAEMKAFDREEVMAAVVEQYREIRVEYLAGDARLKPGESADYMLAKLSGDDASLATELYAELPTVEEGDCSTYDDLKTEILRQAKEYGIPSGRLRFWFDKEERVAGEVRKNIDRHRIDR